MTSRASRRRLALSSAVAAGVLAVTAGCQSSTGESSGKPPAGTSGTTSTSPTEVPVPEPSIPVVEPADGKVVKVPGASMRAFRTYKRVSDYGIVQGYNDSQSAMTLSPNLTQGTSIDGYAKEWIRDNGGPKVMERQGNAVVGGKYNAWHVIDTRDDNEESHYYGVMFLDSAWLINIAIYQGNPDSLTPEEGEEVIASLLASFKTDLD